MVVAAKIFQKMMANIVDAWHDKFRFEAFDGRLYKPPAI